MRVEYAARVLIDLGEHYGQRGTRAADIAARQHIPSLVLDRLLVDLQRAGIVQSTRGRAGGHQLTRPPSAITLGQLLRGIGEGPVLSSCIENSRCTVFQSCVLRDVWCVLAQRFEQMV